MVGELVADGESEAVRPAVVVDDVAADELGLLAVIFGEIGRGERLSRSATTLRAVALVEPLGLHARLAALRVCRLPRPT